MYAPRFIISVILLIVLLSSPHPLMAGGMLEASELKPYLLELTDPSQPGWLLRSGVYVGERRGDFIEVKIDRDQEKSIRELGWNLTTTWDWSGPSPSIIKARDHFHEYDEVVAILQDLNDRFPTLATMYSLGLSHEGRHILGLRISDNIGVEENEPEVRLIGAHHGNEIMSVEIPLEAAKFLLEQYPDDEDARWVVENLAVTIIPLMNPDGRALVRRENAANVDLNRNYGYHWVPSRYHGASPYSEPETKAIAADHLQRTYAVSHSFHTYGQIINYLWNYTPRASPDEPLIIELSEAYALHTQYSVTNGFDWYQTYGDCNDFSYGATGGLDFTIELLLSHDPGEVLISKVWQINKPAILDTFAWALEGVHGVVLDARTGEPVSARVEMVQGEGWPVFTDPAVGDFHKPLLRGTYSLSVEANGYLPFETQVLRVALGEPVHIQVELEPDLESKLHGFRIVMLRSDYENPNYAPGVLGAPDGVYYGMERNGQIAIDLGELTPIHQDSLLRIHSGTGDEREQVRVYLTQQFYEEGTYLGSGAGTFELDAADSGLTQFRYVRLVDAGDVVFTDEPGFDLDAITYWPDGLEPPEDEDEPELEPELEEEWEDEWGDEWEDEWEDEVMNEEIEQPVDEEPEMDPEPEPEPEPELEIPADEDEIDNTEVAEREDEEPGDPDAIDTVDQMEEPETAEEEEPDCPDFSGCWDLRVWSSCWETTATIRAEQVGCLLTVPMCRWRRSQGYRLEMMVLPDGRMEGMNGCYASLQDDGAIKVGGNCGLFDDIPDEAIYGLLTPTDLCEDEPVCVTVPTCEEESESIEEQDGEGADGDEDRAEFDRDEVSLITIKRSLCGSAGGMLAMWPACLIGLWARRRRFRQKMFDRI